MPDILSQGGGRESGPWPRRMAAAAVLVLVAVTIVHYLPRSRHGTARPVPAAVSATPLPPEVSGAVSGDAGVVEEPNGITGRILSWPGDLRLPATGPQPAWFWPATGQVVPIGGLPPQRSGYQFIRTAGGWAVQASPGAPGPLRHVRRTAACRLFPGRSRAVGDAGRAGGRGRPGRGWRAVADQLPSGCRSAHRRGRGAGSQHRWPAARAAVQAAGRVPDRAGDRPRPAAGTGARSGPGRRPTCGGIQPTRRPVAPSTE